MTTSRNEPSPKKTNLVKMAWNEGPMSFAMFLLFVGGPVIYMAYAWVIQPVLWLAGIHLPEWNMGGSSY